MRSEREEEEERERERETWRLYEGRKIFITFRKPVNMQMRMLIARLATPTEGYRSINVHVYNIPVCLFLNVALFNTKID